MSEYVKVAYNACHGGFSLSEKAVLRAREISGNPQWGGACIPGDVYDDGGTVWRIGGLDMAHIDVPRTDPVLISVIEEMGDEASGSCARLRLQTIRQGERYRIDEYDGYESVMTVDDYAWQVA